MVPCLSLHCSSIHPSVCLELTHKNIFFRCRAENLSCESNSAPISVGTIVSNRLFSCRHLFVVHSLFSRWSWSVNLWRLFGRSTNMIITFIKAVFASQIGTVCRDIKHIVYAGARDCDVMSSMLMPIRRIRATGPISCRSKPQASIILLL